jgi:outer membrane protein OmpA-like peptidoglycan-associated protein/opacity protein-like surface antigen
MASKKYTLIAGLLLAATTGGFSQLAGVVDYKDSTKVPSKRMAQQNEWRNNSLTQSFPARPRDMWQLGVYGGLFIVDGDCPPLPGWNVGVQVRKSLGYVFSIRGQVGYGVDKGLDYRRNSALGNNLVYNQYRGTSNYYVPNFKNTTISPSIDVLASLNNIMFHKKSNKVNIYVLGGFTEVIYKTEIDALNGSELYNFASLNDAFFSRPRKDIRSDLKDFFDGDYETAAKVNDRRQNFGNGDQDAWQIRHSWDVGGGIEYKLSNKASLGLELKYVLTPDDYLDAWQYQVGSGGLTPDKDNLIYGNLSINFNLGDPAKKVAPLWWLNPLGYVYSELSNPTIMKFPKPVLDDTDNDGVTDQFDIEPNTPAGCPVDTKGKSRDTDGDGVPDCRDKELITPTSCQPVDADGVGKCPDPACCQGMIKAGTCNIGSLPSVQFASGVKISADATSILDAAAAQIKANPDCKICVVGHGGASKREQQLSWDRVESVISYLVEKQGISRDRFVFKYGEEGDSNTVDLQDCSNEEGPNMVPAPHPQYRKTK